MANFNCPVAESKYIVSVQAKNCKPAEFSLFFNDGITPKPDT